MPLAADDLARMKVGHVRADLDDLTDELMPDSHRDRDRFLSPRVPLVDVDVGAANAGAVHFDQDVVDSVFRLGNILKPQSWGRLPF